MPISFDTAAAERSDEARSLFAKLASGTDEPIVLTTLSGVDLCILGAMSWEALATSWNRLRPEDRSSITEARASEMIERGLLIERSPGQGYEPLARYAVSPKLGIALAARLNPTFIVTSTVSPKQAPLTLFAAGDAAAPVRGIVMEVPSLPARKDNGNSAFDPLSWQFNHLLVTPDFAAQYLAGAAVWKAPENAFHKKTARTVSLYRPGAGPAPTAELTVLGDGTTARVKGPGISGVFDEAALKTIALQLFRQGATSVF
jgi:hypothetical protein